MIDLTLTEDEALIQKTARDFADKELAPLAAQIDRDHVIPKSVFGRLADLGFMGMLAPEDQGGSALSNLALALVLIEINRGCASTGVALSVHNSLCQSPILRHANAEQKARYLPRLAKGEWIGAYSLTEPVSGTDAAALVTTASKDGADWVLNGVKNFVTNGGFADLFVIFARTGPDKTGGITAFLVERASKGFSVGPPEKKMGIRGSSTTTLYLDNVRVPAANVLGAVGEGFKIAMSTLDGGRIGIASQAIGIAEACLAASVKYAKERRQFDRPISDFQAIQWKIAEMGTDIDAAKLLVFRAARLRDAGQPHTREASMAKLFASTMANRHATQAVQIHGGAGYIRDFPVERHFRDAKITEIYEGTSEVQHLVIARSYLR